MKGEFYLWKKEIPWDINPSLETITRFFRLNLKSKF